MAEERLGASFSIDITDLKAGLAQANRLIKESQSKFKAAAAGMDDWTKSQDGLAARIKSLNDITDIQRKKVDALQSEYSTLISGGLDPTSKAAVDLRTKINNEQAALAANEKELQRQQRALEELESASEGASDAAEDAGDAMKESGNAAKDSTGGFTVLKGALADLVADGFRKVTSAAKDFVSGMFDTAAGVKASNSQFSQTFGELEKDATKSINNIAKKTGILETRLQSTGAGIYAFAKSSGADSAQAMSLMDKALMATADNAAYYDKSLDESAETLQSFLKGNYANDAALGVSATEFTRNAKASELFGKKFNELTEIQKQETLLQMVVDAQKASGAFGQAARESDGWENVMGNLDETWKQFQAKVGTPFLEAIIPVIQEITNKFSGWAESVDWDAFADKVKDALGGIKDFGKWIIDNGDYILALLAGIGAGFAAFKVVSLIQKVKKAMESMTIAQYALNLAMSLNPIGLIIAAIVALVAAFVVLWKKSEKFREFWKKLWEGIKKVTSKVWEAIKKVFSSAWDGIKKIFSKVGAFFKECWESIKKAFSGVKTWFANTFNSAWAAIKNAFSNVKQFFTDIWNNIKNIFSNVKTWFSNTFNSAWDGIKNAFSNVKTFFSDVWGKITGVFSGVVTWFKNKFSDAWKAIKDVFSTVGDFFGGIWDTIKEKFTDIGQKVGSAIGDAFKKAINSVLATAETVLNTPINAINGLIDKLGLGIGKLNTFSLPRMAKGGVVDRATAAVIGEDGAEAVVPLEKNLEWLDKLADKLAEKTSTGAGSVVVNQTNNYSQAHSRYELYKSRQQTAAAVRLALQGG